MTGNYSRSAKYFIDRQVVGKTALKEACISTENSKMIRQCMATPYKSTPQSKAVKEEISTYQWYMNKDHCSVSKLHEELLPECRKRSSEAAGLDDDEDKRGLWSLFKHTIHQPWHLRTLPGTGSKDTENISQNQREYTIGSMAPRSNINECLEIHAELNQCITRPSRDYLAYNNRETKAQIEQPEEDEAWNPRDTLEEFWMEQTKQKAQAHKSHMEFWQERNKAREQPKKSRKGSLAEYRAAIAKERANPGCSPKQLKRIRATSRRALKNPDIYKRDLQRDAVKPFKYGKKAANAAGEYVEKKAATIKMIREIENVTAKGGAMQTGLEMKPLSAIPMRVRHLHWKLSSSGD
jgi:hypothetical protein